MNEEVKKIIKASFCPKDKWVRDEDATNCFKCDKKFHALYRRKHHCRYCGQIFCATCSDFYLSGKDLGEADKPIRMCEQCLQKCWKYIAKHDDTYIKNRTSGEYEASQEVPLNKDEIEKYSKVSSFSEEDRLKEIQSIIEDEYEGSVENGIKKLEKEVDVRFAVLLQVIMKQNKIPLVHLPHISDRIKEIVTRLPPNFVVAGQMRVCPNLRIKGFFGEQFSTTLEPCVLIKKAFASKRVKEEYGSMTCMLVFGNIESEDMVGMDREASFENMVNNRLKEMNKIIGYCKRVHVNMIWLEGVIEKEFEDMLHTSQITVISKVKVEYLSRLKTALKIQKIVDAIGKVYSYPEKEITGFIKKMTSFNYVSVKEGNLTKKFFKVWTAKDELGLTLVLQAPTAKFLDNLKKQIGIGVQMLTHLRLKVYKVRMDEELLNSMTEQIRNSCYLNNSEMFFSFYAEFHSDLLSLIKEKYVSYKHISYVESDFSCYPEVNKPALEEYLKGRSHTFKAKWENFTEVCGEIRDEHRMFYSDEDLALGGFLLKRLTGLDKKCAICNKPNYLHLQVFYSTDQYVRVWTESMIIDAPEEENNCYSSFTSQADSVNGEEMEMIFTYLQKHTAKEKLKVFIECFDCQQPLSSRQNVYKADLQYSTLSFLQHMFKGSTETTIRENNSKKVKSRMSMCSHSRKVRVFELGAKSVKFFVGKYTINRQCILTPTGREQFLRSKELRAITEVCMLEGVRIDRLIGYLYDEIKNIAEMSKNAKFDTIIKNPRSSFIKARKSVIGAGNLRLSQAQCVDMIVPELIEEVSKVGNIAQLMMSIKRIGTFLQGLRIAFLFLGMLKRCYLIISEVKKAVRKRQLEQKYQVEDFQNEYLLQDVDINSYADSVSSIDDGSDRNSQTSRSDLMSNFQTLDTSPSDLDYGWLQPFTKEEMTLSRTDRKTESNVLHKKSLKMTEEEAHRLLKSISSALRLQQDSDLIPCFPNRAQSIIAASLNSKQHMDCLNSTSAFANELIIKITNYLDYDVPLVDNEDMRKLITLIETQQRMFDISSKFRKEGASVSIEVQMLYPNEFEVLRRKKVIPLDLFVSSIAGADNWIASGGKSGSPFMRSYNDLLVIKKVPKGQFMTFRKLLPGYFTHLHEGSILTPIYGAFVVNRGNLSPTDYYVVMENLFFGMRQWHLYDFKGSVTRRFSRPPVIPLDINFLIDRHSEPIFAKENVLKNLTATLDYLCQNNVIDYSLILVVEIQNSDQHYLEGNRFQLGIVDYIREFGAGQWVENKWKGAEATVVEPQLYKKRICKNLKKYFTQIPL